MANQTRVQRFEPGGFEPRHHFYERVLNAQIHPLVRYFMQLGNERIAERYCHLHPEADRDAVREVLAYAPSHFRWGGADLFHTTSELGQRHIMVIETNSCPSGQKSMPLLEEAHEQAGYRILMQHAFREVQRARQLPRGGLAVLFDKNPMEASGYAAAMAEAFGEPVWLVPCFDEATDPAYRFTDGVLEVRDTGGVFRPIRAALRYVTQRPWNRIPPVTRTAVFNPVLVCLAGGRNKLIAAKAYDWFNARVREKGLSIHVPETIWDVSLDEVPLWVARMGGVAVVKDPYSNAGQGVFTITCQDELDAFMQLPHRYERFIVQALVGNRDWSSQGADGRLYHVGTVPDKRRRIFATDVRFMVVAGSGGFTPVAVYARRAAEPLTDEPPAPGRSWDVLGTNLSRRLPDGGWRTETERLLLVDGRDFNRLGLGLDLLIEGYLQTAMAVSAIDEMAKQLLTKQRKFRRRLFLSLDPDPALLEEITQ